MRYIYYIIIILLGLSAIIGYELRSKHSSPKEAALIINGKTITADEFSKLCALQPSHSGEKSDCINSLVTKELLIQESQKEGIDREESFRRSIQNYYEQSLIKLLMDGKRASLHIDVTDDELNRYLAFLNKKIHLTIFSFKSMEDTRKGDDRDGEKKIVYFEDLSGDMRNNIISLKEGNRTEPVKTGETYTVIRLDGLENIPSGTPSDFEKDKIKKMLVEEKKEKIINDWIAELKKKASVKILISGNN